MKKSLNKALKKKSLSNLFVYGTLQYDYVLKNLIGNNIYILCNDYKTMNNDELNNINKTILDILNNNKTIISLFNTNNKLYINYINKITTIYNLKHNINNNRILLYNKTIEFIDNNKNSKYINNIKITFYKNNILNKINIAELFYN